MRTITFASGRTLTGGAFNYTGGTITDSGTLSLSGSTTSLGAGFTLGQRSGEPAHTLALTELPNHLHLVNASSSDGNNVIPTGNVLASSLNQSYRAPDQALTTLRPDTITNVELLHNASLLQIGVRVSHFGRGYQPGSSDFRWRL